MASVAERRVLRPRPPRRSPPRPRAFAPAAWSRCRPRRSTASPRTRPSTRGGVDIRRQGTARVQSADRACARRRGGARARDVRRRAPAAGARVLAGPADPRRAGRAGVPRQPAGPRRARHRGAARARATRRPRADRRGRRPARRALGQSLRRASARRPPRMCSPISTARSTGSSTPARARLGLESTIVACLGGAPRLLRPGAITREAIEAALGRAVAGSAAGEAAPIAPGRLALALRAARRAAARGARTRAADEAALDFAGALSGSAAPRRASIFRPPATSSRRRRNLFAYLRALDAAGAPRIAVAPIPERGLGAAINDRLRRAAAPRGK